MKQEHTHSNSYQKACISYFIAMVAFWAYIYVSGHRTSTTLNYWYSFLFGLMPLFGGLVGLVKARQWGGLKSVLGRAVFFISLGLLLWGLGESIWSYYNFFKGVPAPYPSLADLGFAPSIFFYVLGTAILSVATGALVSLRKTRLAKVWVALVPLVLLVPSYYFQVTLARAGVLIPHGETLLKAILDIAYPFGDFLGLTFAAIIYTLSYRYFGGFYRKSIMSLLLGLAVMYGADSVFSYTTTKGTYYNADWGDLLLTAGLFLMTFGVLAFASRPLSALSNAASNVGRSLEPIFDQIAAKIIEQQETIIGPIAIDQAKRVATIQVDWPKRRVDIQGNPQQAIDTLVGIYGELFGQAAIETCREAVSKLLLDIPQEQIPASLQYPSK